MPKTAFAFIFKYIFKLKRLFITVLFGHFLAEVFAQFSLVASSKIVGIISFGFEKQEAFKLAMAFVGLFALFTYLRGLITNQIKFIEANLLPRLRIRIDHDLFKWASNHSLNFFTQEMSGKIAAQMRRISSATAATYHTGGNIIQSLIKIIITFVLVALIDVTLAVLIIIFLCLYSWILYIRGKKISHYTEQSSHYFSIANGVFVDTMFNYGLIKNYARLRYERLNYFQKMRPYIAYDKMVYRAEAFTYTVQALLRALLQAITFALPFYYWLNDKISVADFVLIESLITNFTLYGMNIVNSVVRTFKSVGMVQDGLSMLTKPFEIENLPHAKNILLKTADIKIENMTFHYQDGTEVFKDFNLHITPCEKIGLAGHSGSGKSTLIKLINRYYDITSGKIKFNNIDIKNFTLDSLHKNIATIPQDPSLFNRTIMENIRYGKLDATDEEVYEAAKKAYCHDFIMALPNGYDSKVGEHGVMLSGGERQRIAIARAILKNAPILILDEATSALDSESELFIQKSLHELMKNKTVIAIAHRLSTLREMDRLVVLDKGKIVETGSHQELINQKGVYYDFYTFQAKHYAR